jgi:transposase
VIKLINKNKKYNVGLDIHEEWFYGTILTKEGELVTEGNVKYSKEGIQNFLGSFPSTDIIIAIESCGLSRGVYTLLNELGYEVVQANAKKTHDIAGCKKTDKVDSRTLADLLRTGYLPIVYAPDENVQKLRDTTRHRARLVRTRAKYQTMIKSYLSRDGKKFPGKWNKKTMAELKKMDPLIETFICVIEVLNEQVKQVNKMIKKIAQSNYLVQLLVTIPGIGEYSAILVLGEIGDIKRFDNPKSLVRYSGLCPGVYQSGNKTYDIIDNANNKWLKWIIIECSSRATLLDKKYMKYYLRVKKRKGFRIARRSVARKMIIDIWHILTKEEPFKRSVS